MIEFGAKLSLKDNMYATLKKNLNLQREYSDQVERTNASVRQLSGARANPTINARDNASSVVNSITEAVEQAGAMVATPDIQVEDRATTVIGRIRQDISSMDRVHSLSRAEVDDQASKKLEDINSKIRELGRKVASPVIKLRDLTSSAVGKIKQSLNAIATTFTPIVKIRDLASQGLAKIKNTVGWLGSHVATSVLRVKDNATAGINKVRVAMRTVGKAVASPFISLKDKASPILSRMQGTLKTVGKWVAKPMVALKDGATKVLTGVGNGLKKIGSMSVKAMVGIKDGATSALGKISSMLGSLAKGVTIGIGLAGAGATAILGGSISQGADLEQSLGGVDTLFKDSSGVVKQNADMAFKTAGLSANAYMEQVTSFSASLLQSLGGDTAKSASVADMAIVDMADNANKMGTSVDLIQNAYQGFAKQNYTMLDNLKLGYGGTQEEMKRLLTDATAISGVNYDISNLSDVYNAIHTIQTNLGVTGTTAKEASETFSGSFASMKASAQNLLGNMAVGGDVTGAMENLVETASTFLFNNAIPMIGRVISSLPSAISTGLKKASPQIKQAGGEIVKALKEGMKAILPSSMSGLVDPLFDGLGKGISGSIGRVKSILTGLAPIVTNVITTMAPIVGEIGAMFDRVSPVIQNALVGAFGGNSNSFIQGFASVIQSTIPVVEGIITNLAQVIGTVLPTIFPIIQALGNIFIAVMPIVSNLITIFSQIVQTVFPIVSNVITMVLNAVMPIITAFSGLIQSALPIVEGIIQTFSNVVATIFPVVQTIFQGLGDKIAQIVGVVTDHMGLIQGVFETVSPIIQSAVEIIGTVLSAMWDIVSPIMDLAITIFDALLTCVEAVFPVIQTTIETVWSVLEPIFGGIAKGLGAVGDAIGGVADFIGSGVDTVKSWFGFAYGKDRVPYDNYPAVLHAGEKVLTRNQADQYERANSTRGVQLSDDVKPMPRDPDNPQPTGGTGTAGGQETKEVTKAGSVVNIEKLADTVIIEKEADVDKVVEDMVTKFKKLIPNMP